MTQCEQYAITFMKPEICKFLIDEGADVDFFETHITSDNKLLELGPSVLENTRNSMNVLLISLACPGIV